jgi:diguanylate cyclase (GGDEF)-like protein
VTANSASLLPAENSASQELAALLRQTDAARAALARVQQELQEAGAYLTGPQAAQLVEANEQLVFASLRAQIDAETAAQALRKIPRPAELDALTTLPNRILMRDRYTQAALAASQQQTRFALLYLDLDDFKQINDTLGHAIGDQVLQLAAARLASIVGLTGTVSRHGGDEFLILLAHVDEPQGAARLASRLAAALRVPSRVGGHLLHLGASIGITVYPDDGVDFGVLVDRADTAMYRAKRHPSSKIAFHGQMLDGESSSPKPVRRTLSRRVLLHAEHERRHSQLQEANEQLVLAALSAQQLQLAAQQAQQRQADLLAVVAHELRNPLTPIRTAAAMLGRLRSDEPLLPRIRAILERQVVHMSRLIEDLLDLSRVRTGKLRLLSQTVDMASVIEAASEACKPSIESRGQHFGVQAPAFAMSVNGDAVRLTQVLTNLLDNASKYTPEGGDITLAVTAADGCVTLTLTDSGIGITAEALPNVFEPFVQDAQAVGYSHMGLGIGLTVVRELVEAHGGSVAAHSDGSGCGSQFTVVLPLLH